MRRVVLKVIKWLGIVIGGLVGICLIGLFIIFLNSSDSLAPLQDAHGEPLPHSIAEKKWVDINGVRQGMFIRGEKSDQPVILFLHGGPGAPELPFLISAEQSERLEKYFTVCYWDQRGAGMSYSSSINLESMTVDQLVEDTREITRYLKERFKQDKIILMGHSWGTYLGLQTVHKYPNDYLVYIGIGQISNQLKSEQLAYYYMLDHAQSIGDHQAVRDLKKYDPESEGFPQNDYLMGARISLMNKYGIGLEHKENFSMLPILKDIFFFKGYTFTDKMNYIRGNLFSQKHLFYYVTNDNLFETLNEFQAPVYIVHGKYDYQVSYELAKAYTDSIKAPYKGIYTFENSAHSPNTEEPVQFVKTVQEIIQLVKEK